jgi:hypothetical protein
MTPDQLKKYMAAYPVKLTETGSLRTCPVRLSYPHLFKPHVPKKYPNAAPKYSATLLFPKGADLSLLISEAKEVGFAEFGKGWNFAKGSPLMDQGAENSEGYEAGAMFCRSTSDRRPDVKQRDVKTDCTPDDIYPGVWCLVTLRPFANTYKNSVSLGLGNVIKLCDGERLGGGGIKAEDEFEPIELDDVQFADASNFG